MALSWDDFFEIFGKDRRRSAIFEYVVNLDKQKHGFIDVFMPGTILVEHKSKGKDLDAAFKQAADYFVGTVYRKLTFAVLLMTG